MKRADKIVKELEKEGWGDLYDSKSFKLQQVMPPMHERREFYYTHTFGLKHMTKKGNVLDVGCGDGEFSHMGNEKGFDVTGIDVSDEMIKYCKKHIKGGTFKKMFAEKLEFKDESFDYVTSFQVLEHLKDPNHVIKEMLRVLKKDGIMIITVPILDTLDAMGRAGHLHNWGLYEVMHMFEEFGKDFKIYYINKWRKYDEKGEITKKNVFGIVFKKGDTGG